MSVAFSIRIGEELKKKMDKYRNRINWANEIRRFIEETIRKLEAQENFETILEKLETASWSVPAGFSTDSIEEKSGNS